MAYEACRIAYHAGVSTPSSPRTERRQRQRAANKAAILEAARVLAERDGAVGLSLRAVAAEAGYAPATVYEYFQNRAELVLTLAADDLMRIARAIKTQTAQTATGKLQAAGRAALDLLRNNGPLAEAASALQAGEAPAEAERHFNGRLIAALTAFAEASGRAPVTERDAQGDILLVISTLVGLTVLARAGRLKALGFEEQYLLDRLDRRFAGKIS